MLRGRCAWMLLAALVLGCAGGTDVEGHSTFGTVSLTVDFDVNGQGFNVDSIAFFEAPDPNDTLMFVTAKSGELLEVWQYPFVGNELPPLQHPTFDPSDTNGVAVDPATNLLYVTVPAATSTTSVFSLPDLTFVQEFIAGSVDLGEEPNIALLRLSGGQTRAYVSSETTVYMHDAATGAALGSFLPPKGLETMAGDEYHQVLYIPDENDRTGVYAFDPDGNPLLRGGTNVFGAGVFDADAEGIVIYTCPSDGSTDSGAGWIVVSDQIASQTEFEFFDRVTWEHLGTLVLQGVNLTDGIGSTQRALPGYPLGIFAAIDDDTSTVGVGWHRILEVTGLACEATETDGGSVPDGTTPSGEPLRLSKAGIGQLFLDWGASCLNGNDYAVYEGAVDGQFTNHAPNVCTTSAGSSATIIPQGGDRYFIVVPQGTVLEGSYGLDGQLMERPQSSSSCLPRDDCGCCAGCGNDIREGVEVCDGSDLAGEDCVSLGFESGTLACTMKCDAFDTFSCALCGNGRCELFAGESCESCPSDCNAQLGGPRKDRYCCGPPTVEYAVDCSDARCTAGGNTCAP